MAEIDNRTKGTATTAPPKKLAEKIAGRLEADIIRRGWPTGEVLGSEPELLDRFGVSRGVFREAVRLVEHKQIARMRRGPGGGLVVTEPADGPVIDAVAVYVRFAQVTLEELFEARKVIESTATELAARSLTEADLDELRRDFSPQSAPRDEGEDDAQELHRRLAQLTGNTALELFASVLTRLTALYVGSLPVSPASRRSRTAASHEAHVAIAGALVGANPGLAAHRMERHLDALEEFLRRRRASQTVLSELLGGATDDGRSKLAEDLARTIFREVAQQGWPVGAVLGSEAELIERHDVSRAVLREAIRLLEYHQIARMRRGPGGGLVVTEPGVDAIADAMTLYLEYRGVRPEHLYELRTAVELASVELAAARLDDAGRAEIEDALVRERSDEDADLNVVSHDLHVVLTELSGNRLLSLFLRILVRLSARHTPPEADSRPHAEVAAEVRHVHERIAEAVLSGDGDLARHRMQKHLDALLPYLT